jgi:hypothetical protein
MSTVVFTMGHPYSVVWDVRLPSFKSIFQLKTPRRRPGRSATTVLVAFGATTDRRKHTLTLPKHTLCNHNDLSGYTSFA